MNLHHIIFTTSYAKMKHVFGVKTISECDKIFKERYLVVLRSIAVGPVRKMVKWEKTTAVNFHRVSNTYFLRTDCEKNFDTIFSEMGDIIEEVRSRS